jgi:hypothetical protein
LGPPQRLNARRWARHDVAFDIDDTPLGIALPRPGRCRRGARSATVGAPDDPSAQDHARSRASLGRRSTRHRYSTRADAGGHRHARVRSVADRGRLSLRGPCWSSKWRWGTYPEEYGSTPVWRTRIPDHGYVQSYPTHKL